MKITGYSGSGDILKAYGVQKQNAHKTSGSEKNQQSDVSDTLEISSEAKALQTYQTKLHSISSDVNQDKVNQIKEQIKSGAYQVDSEKIANGILTDQKLDRLV